MWWPGLEAIGVLLPVTQTALIKQTLKLAANANLPLKYTKLNGVEGHAHKQTWVIKCALRRSKYCQFSGFKWVGVGGDVG